MCHFVTLSLVSHDEYLWRKLHFFHIMYVQRARQFEQNITERNLGEIHKPFRLTWISSGQSLLKQCSHFENHTLPPPPAP